MLLTNLDDVRDIEKGESCRYNRLSRQIRLVARRTDNTSPRKS